MVIDDISDVLFFLVWILIQAFQLSAEIMQVFFRLLVEFNQDFLSFVKNWLVFESL